MESMPQMTAPEETFNGLSREEYEAQLLGDIYAALDNPVEGAGANVTGPVAETNESPVVSELATEEGAAAIAGLYYNILGGLYGVYGEAGKQGAIGVLEAIQKAYDEAEMARYAQEATSKQVTEDLKSMDELDKKADKNKTLIGASAGA